MPPVRMGEKAKFCKMLTKIKVLRLKIRLFFAQMLTFDASKMTPEITLTFV